MSQSDELTPGWDAIDAALVRLYGKQEPYHWGTVIRFSLGGPDPLDGISAYSAGGGSHWHYVSYGMTELYSKESDNKKYSGWGFEFTFRLARTGKEAEPPVWPATLMQRLARYVFKTGSVFREGHHIDYGDPLTEETETKLTALLFVADPELLAIETPFGHMTFLQFVGMTGDERNAVAAWNPQGIRGLLAEKNPLLVTDLSRASLLESPAMRARIEAGVKAKQLDTGPH